MALDAATTAALTVGRDQADTIIRRRDEIQHARDQALAIGTDAIEIRSEAIDVAGVAPTRSAVMRTTGVLVAEGDSWFDYPFEDVLKLLEDRYGYDVESVAHKGDTIEDMAYGGGQLDDFTRRLEKLIKRGVVPKAVLLSGGGNDIAGDHFAMLLDHARSSPAGFNADVVTGVIDHRIQTAYVTILAAVTRVCEVKLGRTIPILIHGYDFPVPDGRGFLGGWWILPGPWLDPGFRAKGYRDLPRKIQLIHDLIERFNAMLQRVVALPGFQHVRYVDLRNALSTGADYLQWWDNELHPTPEGFQRITARFVRAL